MASPAGIACSHTIVTIGVALPSIVLIDVTQSAFARPSASCLQHSSWWSWNFLPSAFFTFITTRSTSLPRVARSTAHEPKTATCALRHSVETTFCSSAIISSRHGRSPSHRFRVFAENLRRSRWSAGASQASEEAAAGGGFGALDADDGEEGSGWSIWAWSSLRARVSALSAAAEELSVIGSLRLSRSTFDALCRGLPGRPA